MDLHSQQRVNYNRIAHLYDEPLRDHLVDPNFVRFLEDRPSLRPSSARLLDMGSGTGKQLVANRHIFAAPTMVGLDLEVGFSKVQIRRQHRREEVTLGGFLAYAAQRFRTSQLMAIDDNDYKIGISALGREIEKCGEQVYVDSELCLVTVTGDKGP